MSNVLAFAIILSGVMKLLLYEKKIVYLSRYFGKKREPGAGFARITGKSDEWCVDIQVRKDFCRQGNEYALYLLIKNENIFVEKVSVQAAGISFCKSFHIKGEKISVQGKEYRTKDVLGVEIRDSGEIYIAGYLSGSEKNRTDDIEQERKQFQESETIRSDKQKVQEQETAAVFAADLEQEICTFDNKWEQLINDYPQIHPFEDERVFISIEPKDFIILRASYQKLVNNSFLLHGFYNYRYLILGPDREIGESDGECYYLGVPGTYFEREKMVAVMFGFEGFECAGPVEIGKFGFYMRRVEL